MGLLKRILTPNAERVWTPRSSEVNNDMFIDRPQMKSLEKAFRGPYHIIIHGQSGCGKTWLYKKFFKDSRIPYVTINLNDASRFGSIEGCYVQAIQNGEPKRKSKETVECISSIMPYRVGFSEKNTEEFEIKTESFMHFCNYFHKKYGRKKYAIVYENFEHALNEPGVLDGLSNALMTLDDENFSKFNFKIVIVGVPNQIRHLVSYFNHSETIKNRIMEVPEITGLNSDGVSELLDRGFVRKQHFVVEKKEEVYRLVEIYSLGVPQFIHDIALSASSYAISNDFRVFPKTIEAAALDTVEGSIFLHHSTILANLVNYKKHREFVYKIIKSIANIEANSFNFFAVTDKYNELFPGDGFYVRDAEVFLADLCREPNQVLAFRRDMEAYRFVSPKMKMALRVITGLQDPTRYELLEIDGLRLN